MISDKEVKEAIYQLKHGKVEEANLNIKAIDTLLLLAQAYLSAEMPEELKVIDEYVSSIHEKADEIHKKGFNEALRLCKLASVKDKMRVEELGQTRDDITRVSWRRDLNKALAEIEGRVVPSVEEMLEQLPDMLTQAQVEVIPDSAMYDVDVKKLATFIHAMLKERMK